MEVWKNNNKKGHWVYCGRPGRIKGIDPAHWSWSDGSPPLPFQRSERKRDAHPTNLAPKPISKKWRRERQVDFAINGKIYGIIKGEKRRRVYVVKMASSGGNEYIDETIQEEGGL